MCRECQDIFNLRRKKKTCSCGETSGRYVTNNNIEISGDCFPLGIGNLSQPIRIMRISNINIVFPLKLSSFRKLQHQ